MKTIIGLAVAASIGAAGLYATSTTAQTSTTVQKVCSDGSVIPYRSACKVAGTVRKLCPGGQVVGYTQACPAVTRWVAAPLIEGGFARAKESCASWSPKQFRPAVKGEVFRVSVGGFGWDETGRGIASVYAPITEGTAAYNPTLTYLYRTCLEGVRGG